MRFDHVLGSCSLGLCGAFASYLPSTLALAALVVVLRRPSADGRLDPTVGRPSLAEAQPAD